ncbi:ROK family protein [Actinoallomurus iriomotensis]|uniref:Glucokinase n=1 Tax=Actinoallomurus iriomotensis TaxID=478107 RepID=A0A9W6RMG6_9ACTN|nr:ROK family protein [Actinoallomurus iriomotensis]GLY78926.1 glucokinase [Actinoallomurus iriomotensis]
MTFGDHVLALDIGGTKLAAGVVGRAGDVRSFVRTPTRVEEGPDTTVKRLLDLGRDALAEAGHRAEDMAAVGIGCGGPLDPVTGRVQGPPGLPGWDDVPIVDLVDAAYGRPSFLENDATAAALGEYHYGRWGDVRQMLYLTVSTGVGGGVILDGRLYRGAAGNGGEFGHVVIDWNGRLCGCGQRGCIEAYASGTSIARRANEALATGEASSMREVPVVTAETVSAHAGRGDALARHVWDETTAALGRALAVMINVIEPELVVLGGGVTRAGDALLLPVRRAALSQAMRPAGAAARVELSAHGDTVGVVGAAASAFLHLDGGGRTHDLAERGNRSHRLPPTKEVSSP